MSRNTSPEPLFVLRGHRADVQSLCFCSSSGVLASGDAEGELRVWDLQERRPLHAQRLHTTNAGILQLHVVIGADSRVLLSQGRDGVVKCWQLNHDLSLGEQPIHSIETGSYNFCRCSLLQVSADAYNTDSPAGPRTVLGVAGSDPADVVIWELCSNTAQPVITLRQPRGEQAKHGMCMALQLFVHRSGGVWCACGYEDGTVALWDTQQPQQYVCHSRLHQEPIMSVAVNASGSQGISGAADGSLSFFDIDMASGVLRQTSSIQASKEGISDICIRTDGRIAATAGWDGKVRIWHCRKQQLLAILRYHTKQVACVRFNQDDVLLASGARDGNVAVWSVYPPTASSQLRNELI
eukprot:jgi/Chrzof1/13542/Cz08g01130.t1